MSAGSLTGPKRSSSSCLSETSQASLGMALHGVDLDIATASVKLSKVILPQEECLRYMCRSNFINFN
jgi:hypothetical protein